jgi:hypothetical protein
LTSSGLEKYGRGGGQELEREMNNSQFSLIKAQQHSAIDD